MFQRTFAVFVVAFFIVSQAQAATITASYSSIPTPGLSGFNTYTVHLHSTAPMQGFDFAGDGTPGGANSKGFYGAMNQVNPAGLPTIYSDNNGVITALGGNPLQDSQFLVTSSSVTVPAGFSHEGPNILQGIWAAAAPVGTDYDVAQIVVGSGGLPIRYVGTVTTIENGNVIANQISSGDQLYVSSGFFNNVDANNPGHVNYSFVAGTTPPGIPITWSDFSLANYQPAPGAGPLTGPAIAAAFDPVSQAFSWNTVGSQLGSYQWNVTAHAGAAAEVGSVTVVITQVPEPGVLTLCAALGLFQLAGGRMKRA